MADDKPKKDEEEETEFPLGDGNPFDPKKVIKGMQKKQGKYYPLRLWEVTYFGVQQGQLVTEIHEAHICNYDHGVLTLSERIAFDDEWGAVHNTKLVVPLDNIYKVECKGAMPTGSATIN